MSPKEWKFLFTAIEQLSLETYRRGRQDEKHGKSMNEKAFRMGQGTQLKIRKMYSDFVKNS